MKNLNLILLLIISIFLSSCNIKDISSSGYVTDAETGEPIANAEIMLSSKDLGFAQEGDWEYTTTDEDGYYEIKLKSNHKNFGISASHYWYRFHNDLGNCDSTLNKPSFYEIVGEGNNIDFKLYGRAIFSAPFYKTSSPQSANDYLSITFYSKKDINLEIGESNCAEWGTQTYYGEGLKHYFSDDFAFGYHGGHYLRYRLEWKDGSTGQIHNKLDSLLLETGVSYTDTIFY